MGGEGSGTPKAELLRLDGTQIDRQGVVSKTDYFNFLQLPEEHNAKLDKVMTPEQALKFRNHVVRMKVGTSAIIPMLCGGTKCPMKQCPFHSEKNWPLAEPCPIEMNLIVNWIQSYVEDLGVDPGSRTQMILVNKLVECDIIDYRANIGFAVDEEAWSLIKTNVMSDGERTTEIANIHPLIDIKEKTHRVRAQILEALAATPKEKYKRAAALKRREDSNIGDHFDSLKKAITAATARSRQPTIDKLKEEAEEPEVVDADWSDGSL